MLMPTLKTEIKEHYAPLEERILYLKKLLEDNQKVSQDDTESLILVFLEYLTSTSEVILDNLDKHKQVSIVLWRSIFEVAVIFRVWTQPWLIDDDKELYLKLSKRYSDYWKIKRPEVLRTHKSTEVSRLLNHYRDLPRDEEMYYEYDWSKPLFTSNELENMYTNYKPTFRDVLYKTKRTDGRLQYMLSEYQTSSNLLHFSMISQEIVDIMTVSEVRNRVNDIIQIFCEDYLKVFLKAYSGDNPTLVQLRGLATEQLNIIENYWI